MKFKQHLTEEALRGVPGNPDPADPNKSMPYKKRLGKCYVLAGRYAMDNFKSVLVHGSIEGMGLPRLDHAWCELPGDMVFEPATGNRMTQAEFKNWANPKVDDRYDNKKLMTVILKSHTWGPWK